MGVNIRLYNIVSPNDFKVEYTTSGYTNPYTYVGSYSGGTTIVVISGVNYNTLYYVKITDLLSGQYSIQPTLVTDPNCYSCFSGTSSYCYEIDTTGGGVYNFTYDDVFGITHTGTSNNEIINICAQVDSVTYTGTGAILLTNSFNPCDENSDCLPYFIVTGQSINQFVFSTLRSRIPFRIEWGDGVFTEYPANFNGTTSINGGSNFNTGHTYSSLFTGLIKVKANDLSKIDIIRTDDRIGMNTTGSVIFHTSELSKLTNLDQFYGINTRLYGHTNQLPRTMTRLTSYSGQLSGETSTLPTGLTLLNLPFYERNIISGNTLDLPRTLSVIVCYGTNKITGYLSDMPTGSTRIEIWGNNTITGNTIDLPTYFPNINNVNIYGFSHISGDISYVPLGVSVFRIGGYNTIYGDLQSLSGHSIGTLSLENVQSFSGNSVTGDIKYLPRNMRFIISDGSNTIYGDIIDMPTGLTYFNIKGQNTVHGNISAINNVAPSISTFWVSGYNFISGNTSSLPTTGTLTVFTLTGNNTITGNISNIPVNVYYLVLLGNNTVNEYSGKTWVNNMNRLIVQPTSNFSSSAIDRILQDVSGYTWTFSERFNQSPTIILNGTGTTASQLAIVKLTDPPPNGYGVNLTLNP